MFNFGSLLLAVSLLLLPSTLSADNGSEKNTDVRSISYVSDKNKFGKEFFTIRSDKSVITAFMTEVNITKDVRKIVTAFVCDNEPIYVSFTMAKTETGMNKFDFNGLELLSNAIEKKPDLANAIVEFNFDSYKNNSLLQDMMSEVQALLVSGKDSGKSSNEVLNELLKLGERQAEQYKVLSSHYRNNGEQESVNSLGIGDCTVANIEYLASVITGDKAAMAFAACKVMIYCYNDDPCGLLVPEK